MITSCLIIRPLPEEEELEDELFAHASEDQDTGNEIPVICSTLLQRLRRLLKDRFIFFYLVCTLTELFIVEINAVLVHLIV